MQNHALFVAEIDEVFGADNVLGDNFVQLTIRCPNIEFSHAWRLGYSQTIHNADLCCLLYLIYSTNIRIVSLFDLRGDCESVS